jgi:hypothetical protein
MSVPAPGQPAPSSVAGDTPPAVTPYLPRPILPETKKTRHIHWGSFFCEWSFFLTIEQSERILKEGKTRAALSGRFLQDYFETVSTYQFDRWSDNDKWVTSNLGHPTQGAIIANIFWQNNDNVRFSDQDFHSAAYRKALLQTFAVVTVDAFQWKLGPLSESSIGNVGLPAHWYERDCKQLHTICEPRSGLNDLVLNETVGMAMMIGYQWLDKHVQKRIEGATGSRAVIDTTRMLLNPPQTMANIIRMKRPWFRDNRQ